MKIMIINGPNLNFLGIREKEIYGVMDYNYLVDMVGKEAKLRDIEAVFFQSNHEGDLIDTIQEAYLSKYDGIIISPGGFTHTSVALHDALASVGDMPKVEVHISNISGREAFRHESLTAPACSGQIAGFGLKGYVYALDAVKDMVLS